MGIHKKFEAQKGNLFNSSARRVDSVDLDNENNGEKPRHLPSIIMAERKWFDNNNNNLNLRATNKLHTNES